MLIAVVGSLVLKYQGWQFIAVSVCSMIVCAMMGCSDDVLPETPETEVRNLQSALDAISEAVENGKVVKSVLPITSSNIGWEVRFLDDTSIRFNCANQTLQVII